MDHAGAGFHFLNWLIPSGSVRGRTVEELLNYAKKLLHVFRHPRKPRNQQIGYVTPLVPGCDGKCYGSNWLKSLTCKICDGVTAKKGGAAG
jgi:hypothetical protein